MPVIVFSGCKTGFATALGMSFIVLLCPKAVSPLSSRFRTFLGPIAAVIPSAAALPSYPQR